MKLTFSNLPALGWSLPAERIVDLAGLCEAVGFDRFAVADIPHHYDCVSVMTACLLRTRRLEVESLVTNPYTRLPAAIAAAWATMADLSGGRALLGIGGGVESAARVWVAPWGYERPRPAVAVREAVDVCRRLQRGEEVSQEGAVLRVSPAQLKFACAPPIPVLIAARGKAMLRLAGETAEVAHLASLFLNVEHQRENIARVQEGARRAWRPEGSFEMTCSCRSPSRGTRTPPAAAPRRRSCGWRGPSGIPGSAPTGSAGAARGARRGDPRARHRVG
jgi:5,10-methylenetetrahydromethanopterin reductase